MMLAGVMATGRPKGLATKTAVPWSVSVAGTDITWTLTTSSAYAGVEWGVSPAYTWSVFDAEQQTSHTFTVGAADGVAAATTYAWRMYETTDPLDDPDSRSYTYSGTAAT